MKKIIILLATALISLNIFSQDSTKVAQSIPDNLSIGIGGGIDYGGIGANLIMYPQQNFGLFAAVGYALAGPGFNVGCKIRSVSDNPNPGLLSMDLQCMDTMQP
jgi:hypothetical protein